MFQDKDLTAHHFQGDFDWREGKVVEGDLIQLEQGALDGLRPWSEVLVLQSRSEINMALHCLSSTSVSKSQRAKTIRRWIPELYQTETVAIYFYSPDFWRTNWQNARGRSSTPGLWGECRRERRGRAPARLRRLPPASLLRHLPRRTLPSPCTLPAESWEPSSWLE